MPQTFVSKPYDDPPRSSSMPRKIRELIQDLRRAALSIAAARAVTGISSTLPDSASPSPTESGNDARASQKREVQRKIAEAKR
jgi:hypothetical protein